MSKQTVIYVRHVPRELKSAFKAHCALRGITINQGVIDAIKEKLKKEKIRSSTGDSK